MHQPIRENLEDYLTGSARKIPQEFHEHLAACEDCAIEVRLMEAQADMLRSLQCEESIEPRPGFYARVMDRIAEQKPASIWSVFLQPSFGQRLAIASATLVLLLGTYLVTTDSTEPEVATTAPVMMSEDPGSQPRVLQQERRRDALLVDLASYHEDSLPSLRQ